MAKALVVQGRREHAKASRSSPAAGSGVRFLALIRIKEQAVYLILLKHQTHALFYI